MKKREEILADLLVDKTQNMPDSIKKAFVKRAVDDAKNLIEIIEKDGHIDLQKLSFTIYRAYSLGAALYDGNKLITSDFENEEKTNEESTDEEDNLTARVY